MKRFSAVMMSVVVMGASAHAGVICERAKTEGTNLVGSAYIDRIVNVYQNGQNVASINFGNDENSRNRAADECKKAVDASSCKAIAVDETPGHYETDGLGRAFIEGIPAHIGSQNTATGGVYFNEDACQNSRAQLGAQAAKRVKAQMKKAQRTASRIRQAEIESSGWGPKI